MVYSAGEGPVPFTYSAEAYPLYIRPLGMSLATATTWFFNFILSVTWPRLLRAFKPQGAFGWYAAWNVVGFFAVLFCVPETQGQDARGARHDTVFSVPMRRRVRHGLAQLVYFLPPALHLLPGPPRPAATRAHRRRVPARREAVRPGARARCHRPGVKRGIACGINGLVYAF